MSKLSESKYHSWVKAGLALLYTKEGIEPFVYDEIQKFQWKCLSDICYNNGLMSGTACSMCCTENVVDCPTKKICNISYRGCNFHRDAATRYNTAGCPNKICHCPSCKDKKKMCHCFKRKIQESHCYYGPSYCNTDATKWCSNPWEVAKCFMPPDGYKDKTSRTETDFNGINSVIINYKGFQTKVNKKNIFEKARVISREVRHAPNLEIDDNDLQQYFTDLQTLLSDPGCLATNKDAQNARQKLTQLQKDTLVIGKDDVRKVLVDVAKDVQEKIRTEMDEQKKEAEKQKLDLINTSLALINDIKNQENVSMSKLKHVLSTSLNLIEEKTRESLQALETKKEEGIWEIGAKTEEKTKEAVDAIKEEKNTSIKSVVDEVKRLKTVSEKGKKGLTEMVKKTISACDLQRQEIYSSLQEDLIQHYRTQYSTLPITPLLDGIIDVPLLEMYVPPFPMASVETDNLKRISAQPRERQQLEGPYVKQATETQKVDEMSNIKCNTLSDVFYRNQKCCKNVYITAEPGFGKSSFVKWLVLTWCQAQKPLQEFRECISDTDLQQMREFEFVFLVLLRDTKPEETHVDKMLANHLISWLGRPSQYDKEIVENIMCTRKCLIILDGLDEWRSPNDLTALPNRAARDTCTFITTSRPWKMATVSVKSSQIDQHVQIKNLQSICTSKILPKILNIFKKNDRLRSDGLEVTDTYHQWDQTIFFRHELPKEGRSFLQLLQEKKIEHIAASPVMLMQILYLWNFDQTIGNSQCQIYSNIVDALLARAVEKETVPLLSNYRNALLSGLSYFDNEAENCETYYKLLHDLGKLAFQTLFSDQKESSLVFQGKNIQTGNNDEFLDTVVKVGLLSLKMHMTPRKKRYNYSFYHKTIHEYFAALYIQSVPGDQHVTEKIMTRCNTVSSIIEMGTVFMFLSGFKPEIACEVLQSLQSTINDDPMMEADRRRGYFDSTCTLRNVQDMILNCVEECKSNGHELLDSETNKYAIQFPLYDIQIHCFKDPQETISSLVNIINSDRRRIKSLYLMYKLEENSDLGGRLTYSNLQCLEYLCVEEFGGYSGLTPLEDSKVCPLLISLDRLVHLKYIHLEDIDLGERLVLGPDMKHIERVELDSVSITSTAFHVIVHTVLQCEHSVEVSLDFVTVKDSTSFKQEEAVKQDSLTLPTPRGSSTNLEQEASSMYGVKACLFYEVTISSRTLQEFVDTVEKCQHQVKVDLDKLSVLKPSSSRLGIFDEEDSLTSIFGDDEENNDQEGYERVRDYIRSSCSLTMEKNSFFRIVFMTKFKPKDSENYISDESAHEQTQSNRV